MAARIEGMEIGFHNALSEPITLAGVPRMVAIMNGTMAAVIALGLQVPWLGIPLGIAVHTVAFWLTKQDPYYFEALRRHLRQKPYLDA